MIEKINRLREEIEALSATKAEELENLRIKYLSKKGEVSQLFNDFRNVAAENKREIGQRLNELKEIATEKINSLREALNEKSEADNTIDLTRTAYPIPLGTRHPISLVRNEICDIFGRLGFSIAEGPEVEDDWHVFSALNFAEDHPARDMQDTFFIQRSPRRAAAYPIPPRYKPASWNTHNPRYVSSVRDGCIAMKLFRRAPIVSSIRSRHFISTRTLLLPI